MRLPTSWRTTSLSLLGLTLLLIATLSFGDAQRNTNGNRAVSAPRVYKPTAGGPIKLGGVVDLAKLPKLAPNSRRTRRRPHSPTPHAIA
jgi:hypothetical protein